MSEFIAGTLDEDIGVWKYSRRNWYKAGIDNYTAAPGQNPDRFLQLLNVQSPMTNNLLRRWGYRTFNPNLDDGSTASSDEHTPPLPPPGGSGGALTLLQVATGTDDFNVVETEYQFSFDNPPFGFGFKLSPAQDVTAGSTIILLVHSIPAVVTGVSDGVNTWSLIGKLEDGTMGIYAYKALNVAAASYLTYTANIQQSGAASFSFGMFEFANGTLDTFELTNDATASTLVTSAIATATANEIIVSLAGVSGSTPTLSAGAGWTLEGTMNDTTQAAATIQRAAATASSYTPTINSTGSANYSMAAVAMKGSSVPGIKARRLYDYENQSSEIRTLIATAADATGTASLTNNVVYWDASGIPQTIFTPSALAYHPRAVNSRDYEYFVDGVAADQKKVLISQDGLQYHYTISAAGNTDGTNTTYTGTNLSALQVGQTVTISGFVAHTAQNNGSFTVVSSTDTTVTVANTAGIAESHTATLNFSSVTNWGIVAPTTAPTVGLAGGGGSQSYALSAAANAAGGNTVYTGVGLTSIVDNTIVSIAGFTTTANNGDFTVVSHTPTTVTVNNPSGVLEVAAAILSTANRMYPTVTTNGWAANAHVELAPSNTPGADYFGLWNHTTQAFSNPSNAIDGNESTYTDASASAKQVNACIYSFAASATPITNLALNVLAEVPSGSAGLDNGAVFYSLDTGSTWVTVFQSGNYPKQWSHIPIPDGQDLSKVQVMIENVSHGGMATRVYEINIEGVTVGSQPVNLTKGRVYYIVYGNTITGHWSDLSPASISSGPVLGGNIPLSNIPVSSDGQVNIKAILATADGGDPSILYLVALISAATTSYTDSMAELVLLTQTTYLYTDNNGNEFGVTGNEVPPSDGQFPTKHASRLWLLNGPFLQYSKSVAELTTNTGFIAGRYEEAWPPEFQIDISEVSEIGKGLLSDGQTLYVGTSRHIRRVTGNDPSNFSPAEIVFRDVGLMNQDVWSIVYIESTPIGAMWMTPDHRVILSDFNSYTDVGLTIQTTLNTINKNAEHNSWACFLNDGPYNYYMLAIPTGSNTDPDTLCVFDTRIKEWFIWQLADKVDIGLFYFNLFGVPRWFFMDSNGVPRLFDKTTFRDRSGDTTPVSISHTIQTTWLDIGDGNARKAINEIELITTITGSLVSLDGATTSADFASPISVLSSSSLVQDILGDWKVFPVGASATSRYYRITITGASTSGSAVTDELLGGLILEIMPIHKY